MSFQHLPQELIEEIANYLDIESIVNLNSVLKPENRIGHKFHRDYAFVFHQDVCHKTLQKMMYDFEVYKEPHWDIKLKIKKLMKVFEYIVNPFNFEAFLMTYQLNNAIYRQALTVRNEIITSNYYNMYECAKKLVNVCDKVIFLMDEDIRYMYESNE